MVAHAFMELFKGLRFIIYRGLDIVNITVIDISSENKICFLVLKCTVHVVPWYFYKITAPFEWETLSSSVSTV